MSNFRRLVAGLAALVYVVLFLSKVNISKGINILLLGIVLANQAIDEYERYLESKKKFHLIIPIISLLVISFATFQLIKGV